jgi:glutamyl-tRNA synthetase
VGGARTALFNWLFARREGGVFVLRIEDTDAERSSDEMVEGILDGLRWLGVDWDEGPLSGGPYAPYFQSQRFDRHRAMAQKLLETGHAYYCYCTSEELKERRDAAAKGAREADAAWRYDRRCRSLSSAELGAYEREQRPRAVRFKVDEGATRFQDLVHGPIEFDGANLDDFVILRSDGHPTYHLSVVSDDIEMAITHVIRGDDHISNTPKHILLFRALGAPEPHFAHVPLILGPDKKRLSKRHGATSVMEYAHQGYLPEAMLNFLALLGWSPGAGDRELFSAEELSRVFALDGISGGNAVFNPEKLEWFNQQHIARLAPDELGRRLKPLFEAAHLWDEAYLGDRHAWFFGVLDLLKPRVRRLPEFLTLARYFFTDAIEYDGDAVRRHLRGMADHLLAFEAACGGLSAFDAASIETALRTVAEARGVKAASLIHASRVAVTGTAISPGLFEVLALLGRMRVSARLVTAARLAQNLDA